MNKFGISNYMSEGLMLKQVALEGKRLDLKPFALQQTQPFFTN